MQVGIRTSIVALALAAGCGSVASAPDANGGDPIDASLADAAEPDAAPPPRCTPTAPFGAPIALASLNTTPSSEDSPFLTGDELTIYFSSTRAGGPGNWDVYFATRASINDSFGTPALVAGINTAAMERRPVVTADGLTMYADSFAGDYNVSVSARASTASSFGAFAVAPDLNLGTTDADPFVLPDHSAVYISSDTTGAGDIYRIPRTGTTFGTPVVVTGVNLTTAEFEGSPVLTPDELTLYFQSARTGGVGDFDVWMATRASVVAGFSAPINITAVNSTSIDVAHWISADGCVLYMTRNVSAAGSIDYDLFYAVRGD